MNLYQLRKMDLNLLLALHALLTEQSVTRGAQKLAVGQPAMSSSLKRLRELFDDDLLVRTGHKMQLTQRGQELAVQTEKVLTAVDEMIEPVGAFDPKQLSRVFSLTLNADDSFLLLRPLLQRLHEDAPKVRIEVDAYNTSTPQAIQRGEVDLWVLPDYRAEPSYPSQILFSDDWCFVGCARHHKKTEALGGRDFLRHQFVGFRPARHDYPQPSKFEYRHQRQKHPPIAEVPTRVDAAYAVIGTPYLFGSPQRLATRLAKVLPLRTIGLRGVSRDGFDMVMQWHPINNKDVALTWLRDLIADLCR